MDGLAYIYSVPYSYSLQYSLLPPLLFPVFNVARFVTSGYLDQKFIVLCHASLTSKPDYQSDLCCRWLYSVCPKYPQPLLRLRGDLHRGVNIIPGRIVLHMLILFSIKSEHLLRSWFTDGANMLNHLNIGLFELIFFYPKIENILRSWSIDWTNMLNHTIVPRTQQNVTCFCYIWQLIRLLPNNCLMILAWSQCPYNPGYYCFVCINPW